GLDNRHPVVRGALAGAHPDLGRLLRHRLVGEDADPDPASTFDVMRHGSPGRLDLAAGEPADLLGHQAVLVEAHGRAALGEAGAPAALDLAMDDALWHQHG